MLEYSPPAQHGHKACHYPALRNTPRTNSAIPWCRGPSSNATAPSQISTTSSPAKSASTIARVQSSAGSFGPPSFAAPPRA